MSVMALAAPAGIRPLRSAWLTGLVSLGLGLLLLVHFHDRFWWPPDEGVYGYVAQRLLEGARLHVEIQDLHPGYVQLAGVAALWLFGDDLVSLRYPLVALALAVAALVFRALLAKGQATAALGALVTCGLTLPLFLNPTANWYAQLLSLGLAAAVASPTARGRLPSAMLLGFLVGLVFLFRQLTGVFLGAAVLLWVLQGLRQESPTARGRLAPLLLLAAAGVLAFYLAGKAVALAWPLFAVWPLALLLVGAWHIRPADRLVAVALFRLLAGALLAALPLVLWNLADGGLYEWLQDTFITPWRIAGQSFLATPGYSHLLALALQTLRAPVDPMALVSALLWLAMLLLPLLVGIVALRQWMRALAAGPSAAAPSPLLLFAPFLALVAVHYQIPVYLFFALAPLCLGLLAAAPAGPRRGLLLAAMAPCAALAIWTQAAQPLTRPLADVVAGRRIPLDAPAGLPGASLAMQAEEQALYRALLAVIAERVKPDQTLLALPMNPELYFLSHRHPPVPFFAAQLGLGNAAEFDAALAALRADPPALIVHHSDDKYDTPLSVALLAALLPDYRALPEIGPFRLYLRSSASLEASARRSAPGGADGGAGRDAGWDADPAAAVPTLSRTR